MSEVHTQPERDALEAAARAMTGDDPLHWKMSLHMANKAITAYLTALSERGMRVMPRDPTEAMHREGATTRRDQDNLNKAHNVIIDTSDVWRAMWDAGAQK